MYTRTMAFIASAVLGFGLLCPDATAVIPCPSETVLLAFDGEPDDHYGAAVAIDGDIAIVGAYQDDDACPENEFCNSGAAYIYVRVGGTWMFEQKLTAPDAAMLDIFGGIVAISGETVVVGAVGDDSGGSDAGSAYVFVRSGSVWSLEQKLTASDGAAGDQFGSSISIEVDTLIIGAVDDDNAAGVDAGGAYIFVRNLGFWTQQAKLTALDAAPGDRFGLGVDISGETVIVGAIEDDDGGSGSGSAYVFVRDPDETWSQEAKLTASDAAPNDSFGLSVAIDGDRALCGAYLADVSGLTDAGAAYTFTRSGGIWTQEKKLTACIVEDEAEFGVDVDLDGNIAAIGADRADNNRFAVIPGTGATHVFVRHGGANWEEEAKLVMSGSETGDTMGISVSVSGLTVLSGAYRDHNAGGDNAGAAVVFEASDFFLRVGDYNGDCRIDGADLAVLLASWGASGLADLDGNGVVDGADLAALLALWGGVCY